MKWGDTFLEGMVFGASCRTSRSSSASSKWKLWTESLTFKMTLEDSDERLKGWIFGKGRWEDGKIGRSGRSLSCLFLSSWLHVFIVGDSSLSPRLWLRFFVDGCRLALSAQASHWSCYFQWMQMIAEVWGTVSHSLENFDISETFSPQLRYDRKSCEFSLNSSEAVGSNTIFCGHAHEGEIMVFIFNYFSFLNLKSCEKLIKVAFTRTSVPGFFNDFSWKMKTSRFLPLLAVLWAG